MTDFIPPTPRQIRAARAFLDWSVHDLGEKVGVVGTTISAIERKKISGSLSTLQKISLVLQSAGIEFLSDEGVRPAQNRIRILRGNDGLKTFYDEVYQIALDGNPRTCAITRRIVEFRKWNSEFILMHRQRMEALNLDKKGQRGRYLYPSTHLDNIPVNYEEPRYIPASSFPDISLHIHGDRIATIEISEGGIEVIITENPVVADSFRKLFDMIWVGSSKTPDNKY